MNFFSLEVKSLHVQYLMFPVHQRRPAQLFQSIDRNLFCCILFTANKFPRLKNCDAKAAARVCEDEAAGSSCNHFYFLWQACKTSKILHSSLSTLTFHYRERKMKKKMNVDKNNNYMSDEMAKYAFQFQITGLTGSWRGTHEVWRELVCSLNISFT